MIKKVKIEEIRRFQKIAGLLKEVDIDLSTTPRFNQEPNLSDKDFLNFVWDSIKDDWIEHKFSTMDPASRRGAVEQFLNSIPYSFLRDYWDDYIEHKRRGIEENDIDLSDTPEFTDLSKSKIQREFEKAGVNVKRPIFVYSIDYGMAKRSVGEYIDEILDTIYDLESDPEYEDSYGDVELVIVSNPDNIDPFDFFVEDDPKDIKLKVLIQGAVDDLIFQK